MQILENIFESVCARILPTSCIVCEAFQAHTLCSDCQDKLAIEGLLNYECCYQCGISLQEYEIEQQHCQDCEMNPPYFDETYCLDRYEGRLQKALHQFKYHKRLTFAHGLARAWNQNATDGLKKAEARYLMPVPLSQEKLCTRGFNQSWELARRIRCNATIEKLPDALMRHHTNLPQASGNRINRNKAIHGMFYISGKYQSILENQTVIIFDDVMTSGATLNEIARVLKDNGVSHVTNWVLLRTARPAQPRAQHV